MKRGIMKFFEAFVHPDRDDHPERAEVAHAANLLQIGEFQLLQLAFRKAYGKDMDDHTTDRLFAGYMLYNQVPAWALRYARYIIDLEARGLLTERDPTYHRYDSDYYTFIPEGLRKLALAVGVIVVVMGGALYIGHVGNFQSTSVLPPYFDEKTPLGRDIPALVPPAKAGQRPDPDS